MNVESKRRVGIFVALIVGMMFVVPTMTFGTDAEPQYMLVHFSELPSPETIQAIGSTGSEVLDYMGDGTYLIRRTDALSVNNVLERISNGMVPYTASMKISDELKGASGEIPVRVAIHAGEDSRPIVSMLESLGAKIVKVNTASIHYIRCTVDAGNVPAIAEMNPVSSIHLDPEPQTFMNLITSNTYMGHDTPQPFGFTGSGMLGEVQDNGIDRTHPDLQNVIYTDGTVISDSHGTCTSGIVFGTGAGNIAAQGIAYQAVGAFSDWGTGRIKSVGNLWNGTFNQGSAGMSGVVQSNSWSQGVQDGQYQIYANENDRAAIDYPHVLTLWATGNGNDGTNPGQLSEDAISKNVIGVGAIFHKDTSSMADDQWLLQARGNTPSRGPAADGRQKPDLCGPFDWILTVDRVGSLGYTTTNYYDNFGGTSGATPVVAGSSLLAYEMYQENFFGNNPTNAIPYSSTIKALMIADAFQYPLTGTFAATRNEQGWGTPDMEYMYNLGAEYHQIDEYPQALGSGSVWSRQVYADAANPLKITLSWIDPAAPPTTNAARALRNNLDLKVTSPGGVIYYGNNGLWTSLYSASGTGANQWSTSGSYRDDLNNLENVFVQNPQVGIWTIEVSGRTGDIALGPQHFSLVSSGAKVPITSAGIIDIEHDLYPGESTVSIQVADTDLNTNTNAINTVNVNLKSNAEPAGESVTLTETGLDTSIFTGTKTISRTNSVGVLWVNANDVITATYNDANDGTGSSAIVTDTAIIDGAPPAAPTDFTVHHWAPSESATETRYMRSDEASVNGLTADVLGTTQTTTATSYTLPSVSTIYAGIRVWIRNAAGTETEVTSGTPVAIASATSTQLVSATWSCPQRALQDTDSIVVRMYGGGSSPPATLVEEFSTEQLGASQLDSGTWTAYYYLDERNNVDRIFWGSATYNSRIEGFRWSSMANPLDHNTLNWTHSGAETDHFNIYRAELMTGPYSLIDTVPVGTNTYVDLDRGQADAFLWWYIVRAEDALGNEDLNNNAVQEPNDPIIPYYEIDLTGRAAGDWTFVSFPIGISGDIGTVLPNEATGTQWDVAKWYDSSVKAWKSYRRGATTNTFTTINNQMGVWLHLTANGGDQMLPTGSVGDYPVAPVQITLNAGWNMVGYPSATDRDAATALTGTGATMVAIYISASPYIQDYTNLASVTMTHGHAYWVCVPAATTWAVSP